MKPDWDTLAKEHAGSEHLLVADVDCTEAGKDLCEKYEVKGYPTIKTFYKGGDPMGEVYEGSRSLDALRAHASTFGPRFYERLTLAHKIGIGLVTAFVIFIFGQVARLW